MAEDRIALPVRTEFGFERTTCGCRECTINCEHIPGFLIPADLERIKAHVGGAKRMMAWANVHLLASPGATVMLNGKTFRLPTLVPARKDNGHCIWLRDGQCSVHPVSPFGCAFVDSHMDFVEGKKRSERALQELYRMWQFRNAEYVFVWQTLWLTNKRAPAPEVARQALDAAWEREIRGEGT